MHTKVTILKIFEGVGQDFTMQVVHMYMSLNNLHVKLSSLYVRNTYVYLHICYITEHRDSYHKHDSVNAYGAKSTETMVIITRAAHRVQTQWSSSFHVRSGAKNFF